MTIATIRSVTAALLAMALVASITAKADALTVDLSGIYDGTVICNGIRAEDGTKEKDIDQDANVRIVQNGSALNVFFANAGVHYNGQFVQESTKPANGTATFISCQTDSSLPWRSEMVQVDFTTHFIQACGGDSSANAGKPCHSETDCGGTSGTTTFCAKRQLPHNMNGTSVRLGDHGDQVTCKWTLTFDHLNIHLSPSC